MYMYYTSLLNKQTSLSTFNNSGLSIVHDQLKIGIRASAECFSNAMQATKMEWLNNGVVVNETDPQESAIYLIFSPVNDSIHNQVYVCRLTTADGQQIEQNFTAKVDGKHYYGLIKISPFILQD